MRQDLDFNHGNICSIKHVWLGSERSRTLRRQILAELELAPEHAAGHTATRTSGRVGPRRGAKLAYSDQTPRWKWHLCCCVLGRIESRADTNQARVPLARNDLGSREWTRTTNLPVNSRTLCRLSYAGSSGRSQSSARIG